MNCYDYQNEIARLLDSGQDLTGEMLRHIRQCPACNNFYCNWLSLAKPMALPEDFDADDFTRKVMAKIQKTEQMPVAKYKARVAAKILKYAAVVLLFFGAAKLWNTDIEDEIPEPVNIAVSTNANESAQAIARWSINNIVEIDRQELSIKTAEKLRDYSLAREYQMIVAQANSAYNHLLNCLPVKYTGEPEI